MTLEELDAYLSSDDSPEDCMMLSDLDGLMHSIACSPVLISSQERVPLAIGGDPLDIPDWVLKSISVIYTSIVEGLTTEPPEIEPIFWWAKEGHVIAKDWCEGFMHAVALRSKEWLRLTESGAHGHIMTPILAHLLDEEGNSVLGNVPPHNRRRAEMFSEAIRVRRGSTRIPF